MPIQQLRPYNPSQIFFDVTIDEMINSDCSSLRKSKTQLTNLIYLPFVSLANTDNWPKLDSTDKQIATENNVGAHCYAIELDNEVLTPKYDKGTIFIIDPLAGANDSDIVIVKLAHQHSPLFRQIFIDGDNQYFSAINPKFGGMQEFNEYKINGVVVRAIRNLREQNQAT